ncbi:OmpA family protein [Flavobacterium granuli]|uniref:Outer membrane protein OmpA-like peptidoglycan-associated protein/tetratricopeptide (TPR) repeat protein n=1 Tax=Flavobacterium granuli TaxID=280093 RepID=A0ABU1S421_9FLAO|nr:OmpA family protein [Flavobacterium granuli]MDR6845682.1 outer membrane protein OmpA-like peptidoglycan-associated protein/tetratricopeptide (TPR) repeat protein [Flavobacterium granuli]
MKKITTYFIVFIIGVMNVYSQKSSLAKGDKEYGQFAYVDAINTYERLFEKGYKSPEMLEKLGNSYYFKADLQNAAKWYGELYSLAPDLTPEYYYRYAQSLKAIKEYDTADKMMAKFSQMNINDRRAKLAVEQKDYLAIIKKNSGRYAIEDAGINTENSDFGSSFFGDKIVFTSGRPSGKVYEKKDSWTGEGFTNLYIATKSDNGALSAAERVSGNINSKYNESTAVFTRDGETVYFTRNNYLEKKGKDKNGTINLKIYRATLKKGAWENITELPFNSDNYSVAHPALSPDEKYLYFASDMPGTLGQSDIYKVAINLDGTFGTPENLGDIINTEGRETFPFVTEDNELYFSSDGHPGLGGLDVFVYKVENAKWYKKVLNVGETLNSSKDDFGFLINTVTKLGYFTSNRDGGVGNDDIYKFKELKKIQYPCEQFLAGKVTDKTTGIALDGSKVTLFDSEYKMLKVVMADNKGEFDFGPIECNAKYYIRADKVAYSTIEVPVVIANESGTTFVPLMLDKAIKELKLGDDLAIVLELKTILFDLNKSNIRPDAAIELAKILDVMQQNPNIKVDIRSHTDSRNTAEYNRKLSDRRAKSTMAWLVKNGIDKTRLTAKGYGESQLLNKCSDGAKCSEAEHQANRRSEFIIVK